MAIAAPVTKDAAGARMTAAIRTKKFLMQPY
jgi:hypothetical protein